MGTGHCVLVVPGLAVRRYVEPAVTALQDRGLGAQLLPAPGQPGVPADLRAYGEELAHRIGPGPVELLLGLSVGAQAAAVAAAAAGAGVRHLVLCGPTVDPRARTTPGLLGRWLGAGRVEPPQLAASQVPDWIGAGPRRLSTVVRSALALPLEEVLPAVRSRLTVVHGGRDLVTSHAYAAALAAAHGGLLVVVPGATHSWPYADERRFADVVSGLLS
ncbi:MAG: alpha/beta fold hydrolase [Actinomycetota bacterium]